MKLAFFDIDGTLIRRDFDGTLSLKSRSFNYGIKKAYDLDIDYTKILGKRIFGLTDRSIIKKTLAEIGIDSKRYYDGEDRLFDAIDEYFEKNYPHENNGGYHQLPGIRNFLQILIANGTRLGLVTGNIKKHSDWKLDIAGLNDLFTTGGYGEDAEERWEIMSCAIKRNSDIDQHNICHFGDSPPDLEAAQKCSIKAVAITDKGGGTHSRDELQSVGYGLLIDSWNQIDQIRDYLNQ